MPLPVPEAYADSYDVTPNWLCAAFFHGCRMTPWQPVGADFITTWHDVSFSADSVAWWDGKDNFLFSSLGQLHDCREGSFTVFSQNPVELRRVV